MRGRTVLDRIMEAKVQEVEEHKKQVSLSEMEARAAGRPMPCNFSGALMGDGIRLIAEVKKASPSRGLLAPNFNPVALAKAYAEGGAAAISVLTDSHFQGIMEHLAKVREATAPFKLPVLRKDFIFDPYQVCEARAYGADAYLLIVAILRPEQLKELLAVGQRFWMQALVEVHNEPELALALEAGAEVIGINNRDLHTFHTDLDVTGRLIPLIPMGKIIVSESGIQSREDMIKLQRLGVHAALVGEALVTAPDPGAKVRELLGMAAAVGKKGST